MLTRQPKLSGNTCPAGASPADNVPASRRRGVTVVEMMVAMMIMAIGLLGMASTAGYVVRQVGGATHQTVAATVVLSRMEWMRSLPCDKIKDSTVTTRGVTETWVRGSTVNRVLYVRDTVRYSVSGTAKVRTYTFGVPCW